MLEYVGGGTFHNFLHPSSSSSLSSSSSTPYVVSLPQLLPKLQDIVQALLYLHSLNPPVLHLDIKPSNILLTENGNAKLSDLGESHVFNNNKTLTKIQQTLKTKGIFGVGTPVYMAPEMVIIILLFYFKIDNIFDFVTYEIILFKISTV